MMLDRAADRRTHATIRSSADVGAPSSAALATSIGGSADRIVTSPFSRVLDLQPEQHCEHRASGDENRECNVRHEKSKPDGRCVKDAGDAIEHGETPCFRCFFVVVANNA
jgi:hypothetical protein